MRCPTHGELEHEQVLGPLPGEDLRRRRCGVKAESDVCGKVCHTICARPDCNERAELAVYCTDECAHLDA